MVQKSAKPASASERLVRDIRRATRKHYSAEEKIRIVLDGLRGEARVAEAVAADAGVRRIDQNQPETRGIDFGSAALGHQRLVDPDHSPLPTLPANKGSVWQR
jgi:hypothetical protein